MPTTCTRSFVPHGWVPGQPTAVSLTVVDDGAQTYTWFVEEDYPNGWGVSNISSGGVDNGITIRWFALGPISTTLTYQITPPGQMQGQAQFSGNLLGDGPPGPHTIPIGGEQTLDEFVAAQHPCDTNQPDWTAQPQEVLAWAATWLAGNPLFFQATPLSAPGVPQAYILRSAAISLAHFQARYNDIGSLVPINSTGHPQRWRELPDV